MSKIVMYTSGFCGYCFAAKNLLTGKGLYFEEIRVDKESDKRQEMIEISNRHTVPQILIGEVSIGGYDDLVALDNSGKLEELLSEQGIG